MPKSENELGYHAEGEPTDAQLRLQDNIDNAVQQLFDEMRVIYNDASGQEIAEIEHDISKITEIREMVESLLGLPDVY
jgi:hypothetical protein